MSEVVTNENASATGAQSTLQAATDALNSLSFIETSSTTTYGIPKYTTWVRVLEDVDDWDQTVVESYGRPGLKLRAGDILKVEERLPQNDFWVGSNGKDIGLFPIDPRLAPVVYSKVIGLYDNTADLEEGDVPFRAGQVMDVVSMPSNWWVRVNFDDRIPSRDGKQRLEGTVPFTLTEPVPPEGMSDNPKPECDPDAIDKHPRWENVPEFNVRVLCTYKAQSEREVDLETNDIVVVTKVWASVWYYGSTNGRFGRVSTNHVSKNLTMSTRPPYHRYYVRAMWDRTPGVPGQLDIVLNEVIEVIWINSNGWWEGRSRDGKRQGLFPASYVRRVADAPNMDGR
ncbi:hypothetical protein FRC18_002687 [Serendipita sp. 400]|nr:hypothetical protein FRC18_002687 [Serendipita sp. 400]